LRRSMKVTFATFAIGMMALSGVPFLFSGFWSKEAILHAAHAPGIPHLPFYAGLVAVVLTAFYMTRLMCEVFFGHSRAHREEPSLSGPSHSAHESPKVMTVPLVLLAIFAVVLGFIGTPYWPWLQMMLDPPHPAEPESGGAGLMVLSIILVGVGISAGWWMYGRRLRATAAAKDPLEAAAPGLFVALAGRLGFDELYAATVFRANAFAAALADWFDQWVWGGAVRGLGAFSEFFAVTNRQVDEGAINEGFDGASESLRDSGKAYSRRQTGEAHSYLRGLAMAFVVLALLLVLGGGR
jgi:NADH-quinone oxidoreductase subunit L